MSIKPFPWTITIWRENGSEALSEKPCLSLSAASQKLGRVGQADESGSKAEGQAQSLLHLEIVYRRSVKPKPMVTPCDGMQRTILF